MTWIARISCVAMLTAGAASAQTVPAGWQVVKEHKGLCQFAVPADWTHDKVDKYYMTASDKKADAVVHALSAHVNYAQAVAAAKQTYRPIKMFEETPSRTWYAIAHGAKPGTSWYVATGGSQVCSAEIDFDDPALEATAKKIVNSVGKAK